MSDATTAAPESVSYTLSRPVTLIDKDVTTVTLREPTGADMVKAGKTDNASAYSQRMIEIMGDLPTGTCGKMRARDVIALGRIVAGFLGTDDQTTS